MSSSDDDDSTKPLLIGLNIISSENGPATVNAGSINTIGEAIPGYDAIAFLAEGDGMAAINAGRVSLNLGNGGEASSGTLNGEEMIAFKVTDKCEATLSTSHLDANVNPSPGESVTVFEGIDESKLSINATEQSYQFGAQQNPQEPTAVSEDTETLPTSNMDGKEEDQPQTSSPPNLLAVGTGTATLNKLRGKAKFVHGGTATHILNPNQRQNFTVNDMDGESVCETRQGSVMSTVMGETWGNQGSGNGSSPVPREVEARQRGNDAGTVGTMTVGEIDPTIGPPTVPGHENNEFANIVYHSLRYIFNVLLAYATSKVFTYWWGGTDDKQV